MTAVLGVKVCPSVFINLMEETYVVEKSLASASADPWLVGCPE